MHDLNRVPLTPQQLNQTEVRPWLKAVAAFFLVLLGAVFASLGVEYFSATSISIKACPETKLTSRLLCELGNLVLTHIPAQYRGIYEGVLQFLTAAALMFAALLLVRSRK